MIGTHELRWLICNFSGNIFIFVYRSVHCFEIILHATANAMGHKKYLMLRNKSEIKVLGFYPVSCLSEENP